MEPSETCKLFLRANWKILEQFEKNIGQNVIFIYFNFPYLITFELFHFFWNELKMWNEMKTGDFFPSHRFRVFSFVLRYISLTMSTEYAPFFIHSVISVRSRKKNNLLCRSLWTLQEINALKKTQIRDDLCLEPPTSNP